MKRGLVFILLLNAMLSLAQNIGINQNEPKASLHINGDIAYEEVSLTVSDTLINVIDVNTVREKNYVLHGPSANFALSGISQGINGREINLSNMTGHSMEIYNDYIFTADSFRIQTGTGGTLAVYPGGNVSLKYDTTFMRWVVINAHNYSLNYYGAPAPWALNGNAGTTSANFVGTTDGQPLRFKVNNVLSGIIDSVKANTVLGYAAFKNNGNILGDSNVIIGTNAFKTNSFVARNNVVIGVGAMENNTISEGHVAIGYQALKNFNNSNFPGGTLGSNHNTAIGYKALKDNQGNGTSNTAVGGYALSSNLTGYNNTAVGDFSLRKITNGFNNTAIGANTLKEPSYSENNTAVGSAALNLGGYRSTGVGSGALYSGGTDNVGVGMLAAYGNSSTGNTACGTFSLQSNSNGQNNTAIGYFSMTSGTTGSNNIGIGYKSLLNINGGNFNIGIGYEVNLTNTVGSWNTVIGEHANTSINNLTGVSAIGASTIATTSNKVWLGANIAGMEVQAYGPYTNLSDGRFKENIKENIPGLNFITKLRPVSYTFNIDKLQKHITAKMQDSIAEHYYPDKSEIEKANLEIRTGFIAQEVDSLMKTLDFAFDGVGKPQNETDTYRISYSQFVVPLVKAIQEQQTQIAELKEELNKKQSEFSKELENLKLALESIKHKN